MQKTDHLITAEVEKLKYLFPGKTDLTFVEYAQYFGISRLYAAEHFRKINSGQIKISHYKFGRAIRIPFPDFAHWIVQHKVVNGKPFVMPELMQNGKPRRKRGYTFD